MPVDLRQLDQVKSKKNGKLDARSVEVNWRPMPGMATDVADGWIVGTNRIGRDFGIWRWQDGQWQAMPGFATRIGGPYERPWVVNSRYETYAWNGSDWDRMPGLATDVGDGWIVGTNAIGKDFGIWRWQDGKWEAMPGFGRRIAGPYERPWVVNSRREVYAWNGESWDPMPGAALDVGDGWVIGARSYGKDHRVWRWQGDDWQQVPGRACHIGGRYDQPWIVNHARKVFAWGG